MRRFLIGAVILVSVFLSTPAFSQTNANISGLIEDATHAVLPGANITATSTETGITLKAVSNAAGVYNIIGVQVGTYKISAELAGFQTQTYPDVKIVQSAQVRLNFTLQIRKLEQSVEVNVRTENLLLESSSSAGVVLPEKKLTELPLVNSNVLSLIKVMGGVTMTENPIFGADSTQFAGVSATNINLQRDGVTVNDVRWSTGLNSPVYLNPEMVGEFKMVLAPVDAEYGRGNGQVQVITRSGSNAYHGSAVWNNQNTALDAQEWLKNKQQVPKDWRNQNEYTLSLGGPIIKNKTFFFVSWDQQFSRIRQNNVNYQVPTPCARKGIFRYFDNWSGGNALTNTSPGTLGAFAYLNPGVTATVNGDGSPKTGLVQPDGVTPSNMHLVSVFGPLLKTVQDKTNCSDVGTDSTTGFADSSWVNYNSSALFDSLRVPDTSGFTKKFMSTYVPMPNNYQIGDGLNWGGFRFVRPLVGGDNVYGLGEGPNRRQINFRIDHNFSVRHRVNGTFSYENDNGEDAFSSLPASFAKSYGGSLLRHPKSFAVSFISTLRPTLLNEARAGLSRTDSTTYNPLDNPENGGGLAKALLSLYPTNSGVPLIAGFGSPGFEIGNGGGVHVWGMGRGNFATTWGGNDPRWDFADTITWTKGRHSFKFGGEVQLTQSNQNIDGMISFGTGDTYYPAVRSAGIQYSGLDANKGLTTAFLTTNPAAIPGAAGWLYGGNIVSGMYNLLNIDAGYISNLDQYRFINYPTDTVYNDVAKGQYVHINNYRQNQWDVFAKDDWKVSDALTLNLGVRYEKYNVPYLANGMTPGLAGGATALFGRSGRSFANWMPATSYDANGNPIGNQDPTLDSKIIFIGPGSPNPNQQLYNDDWNNFGPAIGFAWQLPWFGKGKTTLRGGYQLNYIGMGRSDSFLSANYAPMIQYYNSFTANSQTPYMSLNNLQSLTYNGSSVIPVVPLPSFVQPPTVNGTLPVSERSQGVGAYDPNLVSPYIQNLTMSVTRNISSNVTIDVRYIGTLTRKLMSTVNLNSANIWTNGLKQAFDLARAGGESPLLNRMFNGINISGGCGPVGTTCGGVLQTGAGQLRAFTTTSGNLANGNYIGLAGTLATMNINPAYTGNSSYTVAVDTNGTVLRQTGFPENFIYTNPQYSSATWSGNFYHANYHSMQAQVTVRPTHGFSVSSTYTWSRNLGDAPNGITDVRNRAYDYGVNSMQREHQIAVNGAYELPFGKGHSLLNSGNGVVERIAAGWQLSWIGNWATGRPFGITEANNALYGNSVPNLGAAFDTKSGSVYWPGNASAGQYFWDAANNAPMYQAVADPQCSNLGLVGASLAGSCSMQAIVTTASYKAAIAAPNSTSAPDKSKYQYVFTNALPTTYGNFQWGQLTNAAVWSVDMAMSKAIRITEGKTLQFRMDATNIFNHQQPTTSVAGSGVVRTNVSYSPPVNTMGYFYSFTDGSYAMRPLGYMDAKYGARTFQAKIRFDF